MKPRILFTITW